ncbi:MAG: hypothetical protein ACTSW1_17885, partial [Candidatus Hodarchaeales archaeon]
MISSSSQENEVVKWLLSEIINYHTKGSPTTNKYSRAWASKTRMHKFIYSILEEFDINVTRSLYMWGGFVHNDILGNQFSKYCSYYHSKPDLANHNRKTVKEYGIPIEDILDYIVKFDDKISHLDSMNKLQYYYIENIPEEYNTLYTSKQFVIVDISKLKTHNNLINPTLFLATCDNLSENLSKYHISSFELIDDRKLIDTNYTFTELLETSLEKIKYQLYKDEKILKKTTSFYNEANSFFTNYSWKPYACEVSQETVKGIRARTEKTKMNRASKKAIREAPNALSGLKERYEENTLSMNWTEYQFLKTKEETADYESTVNEI